MTTTANPTDSIKMPLVLSTTRVFWIAFGVNLVLDAVIAVALLGFGIATGYEGRPVFNGSHLKQAIGYLFGGVGDLFAFIGVLALIGVLIWAILKLARKDQMVGAVLCGVAIFAIGGLTSRFLGVGTNIVPMLVFVAFVAMQSGVTTALLSRRANH